MKTATPVALWGALFSVLCSPFSALAVEPPRLVTWELDPFAQTTENVVAALARVTPNADGGYTIDVAFDMERLLLPHPDDDPRGPMDLWLHHPGPRPQRQVHPAHPRRTRQALPIRRRRRPQARGRRLHGRGRGRLPPGARPASLNAVEALQSSVLRGRGRFVPSGLHAPFSVLRGREADASSPTSIRGKRLSFPIPLRKGRTQSDTEASTETHRGA